MIEIIYLLFELCYPHKDNTTSSSAHNVTSDYTARSPTRELSTSKSRDAIDADDDEIEAGSKRKQSTVTSLPVIPIPEKVIVPCLRPGSKPAYINHVSMLFQIIQDLAVVCVGCHNIMKSFLLSSEDNSYKK